MQIYVYFISTPIGNLEDFSWRGEAALKAVDCVLCEDTRITSRLLSKLALKKPLMVYNDHTALHILPKIVDNIVKRRMTYALVSDAGTPLISDPGYRLVNACIEHNIGYTAIPGACAAINALVLSGMPSDRFMFVGFANKKKFEYLRSIDASLIFYESPYRVVATLENMKKTFEDRIVAIVREMTKVFEEVVRGKFDEVIEQLKMNKPRGEFAIVLSPPGFGK